MENKNQAARTNGGAETQVFVGVGANLIQDGLRCYAITVRVTGTIISAINVEAEGGIIQPYNPTWLGIPLNQGEYLVPLMPIHEITLTAATDSISCHCDRSY